jgi:glycine/D-amino acid oxidase-like deaminating enzyme/nitrite reductase/ring-hydroxylating ferredoxin subunit
MATSQVPEQPNLTQNLRTEVCVIGAGIAGLTTAYLLARQGKRVAVIDSSTIGGGQTERTTAHLTNVLDDHYFEIEQLHGERGARLAAQSHGAAVSQIEKIVAEEKIECDFERVDGYLFVPPGDSIRLLEKELQAARRAGLAGVEMIQRAPLANFNTGPCLRFPQQAQFHPLKYLAGLAQAITRLGGEIYTRTQVIEIKGGALPRALTSKGQVITAETMVIATNNPINDRILINTKLAAYRTYVIGVEIPAGSVTKALYWDTADPYHYVRLQPGAGQNGNDILIVGGEDHRTGQADDADERYDRLEAWTRERFPVAQTVQFHWSGQVMESIDGLAYIGLDLTDGPNVYIATGDSGMGMTHGTIAAMLLTDLILKRRNPWAALYDPARFPLRAVSDFAQEGLKTFSQYSEWLNEGMVEKLRQIAPGTGAIIRRGLKKLAVYRDEQGNLHQCLAVCPHLGCVVAWNSKEHTWDCPCHGSQFDPYGRVINGPARDDLASHNG